MTSDEVTWRATETTPAPLVRRHASRQTDARIMTVRLSPDATLVAIQRSDKQNYYKSTSLDFFALHDWSLLWSIEIPWPRPNTSAHLVEPMFIDNERYIIADTEIAMFERAQLLWRVEIPKPDLPPRGYEYWPRPEEWAITSSETPRRDGSRVLVRVRWARALEPAGYNYGVWQDAESVEAISVDDGRWLERLEQHEGNERREEKTSIYEQVLPMRACNYVDGDQECISRGVLLGTLIHPRDRRITCADFSSDLNRFVVVLDGHEIIEYATSGASS